jgi:hypothetical protein
LGIALEGAESAKVVFQIRCGDTVEAAHPTLVAAVIGVDILDMSRAAATLTTCVVDGMMFDVPGFGGCGQGGAGIGTQDRVFG